MAQSHYDWRNGPAEIDPHSVTKHEVLVGYLIRYFEQRTLNARGRERLRITLVRAIDPKDARTPAHQAALTRIVQNNERLVKRLSERKADIALLLDGLAGKPAPDR